MYDQEDFDDFGARDALDYAYDRKNKNKNAANAILRRGPSERRNALGESRNLAQFGWVSKGLTELANTRRHVISLNRACSLIVPQAFPLQLLANTPGGLLNAVRLATRGSAVKAYARQIVAAVPIDVTLNLGSVRSFGVHVRITDSILNFKPGTYTVQLFDGATQVNEVAILPVKGQVDIIMLGISNAGGMAAVPGIDNPQVKFLAASSDFVGSSTALFAETLNDRDLGVIENANGGLASPNCC